MAVPRRDSLQASLPQPLQCDSHAVRPLSLQITMAAAQRQASQTTSMQHLQGDSHAAQTLVLQITMAPVHRHTSQTSFTRKTASGTSGDNARRSPFWRLWVLRLPRRQPAAPAATTRAAAPSGGSGYCACHEEDSQRHQRRQRAPQPLLEALGTAPATKTASGTQRHQRRQRAPQPLLEALGTAPATRKTASGTSGDDPCRSPFSRSIGSGYCACHEDSQRHQRRQPAPQPLLEALGCACHEEDSQRHQRRQRAPQPLLEALGTAPATKTASGTSGDNPRRSPFWRLWVLRLPRGRQPAAPAATTRAAAPSGGSGYCACHEEDSQRHQRRQPAPQPLLEALGTAPATKTASGTSGDNPRRSPFWRLWVLRLPRRQPAATTRATAPSGGSGYCACHEDSQRHQRRQPAPQPLLAALGTAPATRKTASGTSFDNARHSPFWRLWVLRLPRRQPAAPAATTRAAAPSGGSGYCACHKEDSQRHQRRQRAPQPLLEALGTAPATKTASGTSGDNPRRSPFWRLWVLRL